MLHFPEEYFKTEVRDGFAISELMKRTWAAQLEVLNKVIEICDKYNLTYYAYWGTLLGTVRHQGYIPWDDDLDIAMKRDDYIKFMQVAKEELGEGFRIGSCYTDVEYDEAFARITNGSVLTFSNDRMIPYHNCPLVVGIDIFPLYYIPRDADELEALKMILGTISNMIVMIGDADEQKLSVDDIAIAQGLVNLEKLTGYRFTTDRPIRSQLFILYDQVSQLFGEEESDELTVFPLYFKGGYTVKKELLAESIQLPFENIMINAPKAYDEILKKSFGDYMVPRRVRAAHDYPFYREQLQILINHLEANEKIGNMEKKDFENKIPEQKDKKKVLLFHISAVELICNGGYALKKMRYVFDVIRNTPEVLWWWYSCIIDNPVFTSAHKMSPELFDEYRRMTEIFKNEQLGIYDDSGDMQRAVAMADGYYGDEGEVMELFKTTGKPIMLLNYEITK